MRLEVEYQQLKHDIDDLTLQVFTV